MQDVYLNVWRKADSFDPARASQGSWDIALAARSPDWYYQNARVFLQPMFQSAPHPSPVNYGGYRDPAVDRLIETALSSFQPGQAEQAWREVERRVLQNKRQDRVEEWLERLRRDANIRIFE